jgi:DNA-binding CsgD family transcriptional regulator
MTEVESSAASLFGRRSECDRLSRLISDIQAGKSRVLVLHGEAGIGKTALLEFLVERAAGFEIIRAAGVESEIELPYAGLHFLCRPYLDRVASLPSSQRDALETAFGLCTGAPPDRYMVGLAVLTLLSELAEARPLICVVDDAQWLDRTSADSLEFVGRRLAADSVALVFATRDSGDEPPLGGLPDLVLRGLDIDDARALLRRAVPVTLDPRVRDRILAEARGNPLALLELPRELSAPELVFGGTSGSLGDRSLTARLEKGFERQSASMPEASRALLLLAAAEPVGDVPLLWRAAERLGLGRDAATAPQAAGLIQLSDHVQFRHPLVRSAVYHSAPPSLRRQVHDALASVIDPEVDPDRRAWHRARAALGPDEQVAAELQNCASRAAEMGGLASAAAFLHSAVTMTPDPAARAQRALEAAQAKATAGLPADAEQLLAIAEAGPTDELGQARIDLVRASIAYNSSHGSDALPLLMAGARRLEVIDRAMARATYLEAMSAAIFAGRLAGGPTVGLRQVADAIRAVPSPEVPSRADLLLDGNALLHSAGYAAAVPMLREAVAAFDVDDLSMGEALGSLWSAAVAALDLWDDNRWAALSQRHLQVVRQAGALSLLPLGLVSRAMHDIYSGNLDNAQALVDEMSWVAEVTGGASTITRLPESCLAAMRGHEQQADALMNDALAEALALGQGLGLDVINAGRALLNNSLGRYEAALAAARKVCDDPIQTPPIRWALPELIEAAVRSGRPDLARAALEHLAEMTQCSGTDYALGVTAAKAALLLDGTAAEESYREATDRLGRTRMRLDLARAHLLYGEWLRRKSRRVDARSELQSAHEMFAAMGSEGFAERAGRELLATGATVRQRTVETRNELTPQEVQIAILARDGLSNSEIASRLFLGPRTVEWHLRKVFVKLDIRRRGQLSVALGGVRTA